ncbi:RNA polymerase sigma factor [Deinococcus wulumuqiensis]|uniref:RNA polymerase sigma factor n=1 Tax=Deinococcus wulumuqiensis TaxID=980427 RepID=UPI0035EF34D2
MSADHSSHAPHAGPFSTDSGPRPGASPPPPSDEQVLRDMAAGHEGALLELHRRYARALYGLGERILASPDAVQQGVEDALMIAWHHAAHYEPARASVHGWLISIAHHRFLQLRRGLGGTMRLHDQFGRLDTPATRTCTCWPWPTTAASRPPACPKSAACPSPPSRKHCSRPCSAFRGWRRKPCRQPWPMPSPGLPTRIL